MLIPTTETKGNCMKYEDMHEYVCDAIMDKSTISYPNYRGSINPFNSNDLDDIAAYINETALFRNQWQYRPEPGENDDDFKSRIRPILREQLASAKANGLLVPQVVYGYFPANSDGDELVVWSDEARTTEACRFRYPRQHEADRKSTRLNSSHT